MTDSTIRGYSTYKLPSEWKIKKPNIHETIQTEYIESSKKKTNLVPITLVTYINSLMRKMPSFKDIKLDEIYNKNNMNIIREHALYILLKLNNIDSEIERLRSILFLNIKNNNHNANIEIEDIIHNHFKIKNTILKNYIDYFTMLFVCEELELYYTKQTNTLKKWCDDNKAISKEIINYIDTGKTLTDTLTYIEEHPLMEDHGEIKWIMSGLTLVELRTILGFEDVVKKIMLAFELAS
jgi:hypothetical protein